MSNAKTLTTIVTGTSAAAREDTIVAALTILLPAANSTTRSTTEPALTIAVLLEGVPDGSDRFSRECLSGLQQNAGFQLLPIVRIAPGCLCCTGNLTMRVHLNRLLRTRPQRLYISVSAGTHMTALQEFLSQPPYNELLVLNGVLAA